MDETMYNDTGVEKALAKVIEIRLQRRKIYGDSWRETKDWELLAFIKEKCRRLESLTFSRERNTYESTTDTLIDIINYSLFALENEIDRKQKSDKK